jgi:hypothetical protein
MAKIRIKCDNCGGTLKNRAILYEHKKTGKMMLRIFMERPLTRAANVLDVTLFAIGQRHPGAKTKIQPAKKGRL